MKQYLELLKDVLQTGQTVGDRTGTGTISKFATTMKFDLREGFPLLTTKKLHWSSIVHELLWFISGDTNTKYLTDNGVSIWNEWANSEGDLGPVYGAQWRNWSGIDQLTDVIASIQNNPQSRRHIVSAWNVARLPQMALPPCHMMYQLYCAADNVLDLQIYQRSADMFIGVPYNIASYALLLTILAKITGRVPGTLTWVGGDTHIYSNHIDQAMEQLSREPSTLSHVYVDDLVNIDHYTIENIKLTNYIAQAHIKAPIAI